MKIRFRRIIAVFLIYLIVSYLVVGYIANAVFAQIHWSEGVTIWQKLNQYYIRTFTQDIMISIFVAAFITFTFDFITKEKS